MKQILRILPFIIFIFCVFTSLHYFVYVVASRNFENDFSKMIFFFLLTLGLISIPIGFVATRLKSKLLKLITWYGYTWMGIFTILFFLAILEALISIFYQHDHSYWILAIGLLISIWSLTNGLSFPIVSTHYLENEKLNGLSLVQISDLHIGMLHLNESWLKNVVAKVEELNPHIFVITGDLIEGDFVDISPQLDALRSLSRIPHKYFITGNHEYIHGGSIWEDRLQDMGFQVLHNTNEIIEFNNGQILVAGVPDRMIRRFTKQSFSRPDLALKTDQATDYKILLAHQPASVFDLKGEFCDLILSGHTHGGQLFPFHVFVRGAQPVVKGFKTIKNIKVFAHQGTGLWGPPMRWFSRSEIVIFKWK